MIFFLFLPMVFQWKVSWLICVWLTNLCLAERLSLAIYCSNHQDFFWISAVLCVVQIGQGTYSNVYKAKDLVTGKIVALKKVRFDNLEPESVKFMAREIVVLRKLDHPNVVKLEGLVTSRMSCSLYLVFEYMEHDLAGLAAGQGVKFTEPQVLNILSWCFCPLLNAFCTYLCYD